MSLPQTVQHSESDALPSDASTPLTGTTAPPVYPAKIWRRGLAVSIDGIISIGITFACGGFDGFALGKPLQQAWTSVILMTVIGFCYQMGFLKFLSQTPGKMLVGITVVRAEDGGHELSWKHVGIRSASGYLSFLFSFAPQSVALFREDRRQVADLLAGTRVVQKKERAAPKKRPIIGTLAILYFLITGAISAASYLSSIKFSSEGMRIETPVPPSDSTE